MDWFNFLVFTKLFSIRTKEKNNGQKREEWKRWRKNKNLKGSILKQMKKEMKETKKKQKIIQQMEVIVWRYLLHLLLPHLSSIIRLC